MRVPALETERLIIRPFTMDDLDAIHHILDVDLGPIAEDEQPQTIEERTAWLRWTIMSYEQLDKLLQPPYGDRAVVRKEDQRLIGACGFAPCLGPFEQLPYFRERTDTANTSFDTPEVGLYYAFARAAWGHGYATETSRALIAYAFKEMALKRVVATTTHDNARSIGVMQRLGMRIERRTQPGWLQVVGILDNQA